jgi:hypothetical protein
MALVFLALLPSCGGLDPRNEAKGLGTLVLPLETSVAEGIKFRLRDATFRVTSVPPGLTRLLQTDDRKTQEIRVELLPGTYRIEITPNRGSYQVDRVAEDQSVEPAENVELLSPAIQVVELRNAEDTRVTFQFEVDGIALGFGDLVFVVDVTERPADGGSGGAVGSGGTAGSSDQGGTASSFGLCSDCLDAQVPDNLNQQCSSVAQCAAVRECAVDSQCYFASAHECYCGAGVTVGECVAPAFVPSGACAAQIVAALTLDGEALANANVVGVTTASFTTSGKAFGILLPAQEFQLCVAECGL